MAIDLEIIRSRNPIENMVGEKFPLKKSGTRYIGVEHDSLVVIPNTGFYFWNSRGEHGDVFDFVGRHILGDGSWNNHNPDQFMESVRWLAQRANVPLESSAEFRRSTAWAERQLIERLHKTLLNTPHALTYVMEKRGWQLTTIQAARLGYMPEDRHRLIADLNLPEQWRAVVLGFPPDMIIYVHQQGGCLKYLSGRAISKKRHYNPPREILGERQPYTNYMYNRTADQVVLVEGQADAISFAEWGIPALALGGMTVSEDLLALLKSHKRVFVALDNTDDAREQSTQIARELGSRAYLPELPEGVKDANEWLVANHATAEDAAAMLNRSKSWLAVEVERVKQMDGIAQEDAMRRLFDYAAELDEFRLAQFKEMMTELGMKARTFNGLLKTTYSHHPPDEKDEGVLEVFNDTIPVLSPAQGFWRDLAIVTVSLRERTKNNRLNVQPYLITSTREIRRLTSEQILKIEEQEIALRVLPEGSEFLMRWRYRDIQRFLDGETTPPGEVFDLVHNLFTTHVDFGSPVESQVLALWTIGTYFYTLFPAYPYVALNGPKNSGKSTVLRVLQPIAFNMITTSDPTGPAMFRLIHYASCTVGIDEAERYHNPRDPGMQQIRQLLNSGYKQGMPAIRLIGEDMKPQAFDVYSPKILAAIAGLEDVLASRCITIPMRRADRQMPLLRPDFDGAEIRHLLYTLALTHFQSVYRNYFERPELHTLHNRSGELWSPLVALAAFFEEEGGVAGLLGGISEAASWDEQLSEGKALSDREEAVLQAMEILTRDQPDEVWLKASVLREQVAILLGQPVEQLGHSQWIAHILSRLHLLDNRRRKRLMDGMVYAVQRAVVLDMMERYNVSAIQN
jgi:hypothetical protein